MSLFSKRSLIVIVILLLIGIGTFVFMSKKPKSLPVVEEKPAYIQKVIGTSVEGREIESYTYGSGPKHLVFVGGIHGGYEWNSVLLAYEIMDYLEADPTRVPASLTVTIIPSANPDGVYKVTRKEGRFTARDVSTLSWSISTTILASGRFNANNVDLNRNFDCKWKPESTWQGKKVSAGSKAFSEPEARTIRDFILQNKSNIKGVVFWHSQANTVYASECKLGILPTTLDLMNVYSKAASYKAVKKFDAYEVSGDAESWLASINIPAITVELKNHTDLDLAQNLAGVKAVFDYFK